MRLSSPRSGRALFADTPHSLTDGQGERWPVIDAIPYLRAGSRALAKEALACLDRGDADAAACLLLAENDAWWDGAPPHPADLRELLAGRGRMSLREAMGALGWGRVGDYFAHRWSDPTFVAGLALTNAFWRAPRSGFELACGIGHHLLAWQNAGVAVTGGDVVWAKLWVARHFLLGDAARLVCFDAEQPWPVQSRFDLAGCHDAFYFFRDKAAVAAALRAAVAADGVLLVAHVHHSGADNLSAGHAMSREALRALFPGAMLFDDAELTRAGAQSEAPCPAPLSDDAACGEVEAFSLAVAGDAAPRAAAGAVGVPREGAPLVRNPLLTPQGIAWPSLRYRDEYAALASYGRAGAVPETARMGPETAAAAARRDLLDLPARW